MWTNLFFPPWVRPYYVADLTPALVQAGQTWTQLVCWRGPGKDVLYLIKADPLTSILNWRFQTASPIGRFPYGYSVAPDDSGIG